jgi:Protein of unknown function (DUF2924)
MVLAEGFGWNEQMHKSLPAVASAIAGTRWNGHRFFRLGNAGKVRRAASRKKAHQAGKELPGGRRTTELMSYVIDI